MDQLFRALDTFKDKAQDAIFALSSCLCQPDAKIKVNGRSFKIVRILGEGGFSFVYLAQDESTGREFALKKIRCPMGRQAVKEAMREVEAYRRFRHRNVIRIMDSAVVDDPNGEGKIVYLFLPYYRRGNIQDAIHSNSINGGRFSEREMVQLFLGTCQGVSAMHDFHTAAGGTSKTASSSKGSKYPPRLSQDDDDAHDQESLLPQPEGDEEGGFSYSGRAPPPRRQSKPKPGRAIDVVFDGDDETREIEHATRDGPSGATVHVPYAHRDIKPANVMIDDEGQPILMDFGSTIKARISIENRSQALAQQDLAAEQSSMAYRAPELWDVKTGVTIDEKVDIWSLGCVLFAMAYGHSPFETNQTMEQGGSLAMAVMNAQYKHPRDSAYSQGLRDLIDSMLKADASQRPDIHEVIEQTQALLQTLG